MSRPPLGRIAVRVRLTLVLLLALTGYASEGAAHQMNLTNARLQLKPSGTVELELAIKASDLDRALGTRLHAEQTATVDRERLNGASDRIAAYVTSHAVIEARGGAPCRPSAVRLEPDGDGIVARTHWACAGVAGDLVYRSTVLIDVDPAARQVVVITASSESSQALLDASHDEVRLAAPALLLKVIHRYIVAGIEHIFLGYDHIAFLLGIVLWAQRLWPVIKMVTAFTIAHSITLSLAALQIVVVPSTIIEPAIAASIIYVSLENFFSRSVDKRWRDTFAFGLIHGFGFASALQEFGLPPGAVVPALGAFNLGVEIGQVAMVSIVIPALIGADRVISAISGKKPARMAPVVYGLSAGIAGLGLYWFIQRTVLA